MDYQSQFYEYSFPPYTSTQSEPSGSLPNRPYADNIAYEHPIDANTVIGLFVSGNGQRLSPPPPHFPALAEANIEFEQALAEFICPEPLYGDSGEGYTAPTAAAGSFQHSQDPQTAGAHVRSRSRRVSAPSTLQRSTNRESSRRGHKIRINRSHHQSHSSGLIREFKQSLCSLPAIPGLNILYQRGPPGSYMVLCPVKKCQKEQRNSYLVRHIYEGHPDIAQQLFGAPCADCSKPLDTWARWTEHYGTHS